MRGTIAKRLRKEATIEATTRHRDAVSRFGLCAVVGIITRAKKRLLKRVVKFNIESINRQTMVSRTEAKTRTKKIVWSFGTRDRSGRLRGRGTGQVIGTQIASHYSSGHRRERNFSNRYEQK